MCLIVILIREYVLISIIFTLKLLYQKILISISDRNYSTCYSCLILGVMIYWTGTQYIWLLVLAIGRFVSCKQSFTASFQKDIQGSSSATTDVWIEFSKHIPSTMEFTTCHWTKIQFYNLKTAATLWSYCTIKNPGEK